MKNPGKVALPGFLFVFDCDDLLEHVADVDVGTPRL